MIPQARREAIVASLRHRAFVPISELAARHNVSEMTIRRDLAILETQGLVSQVTGGARLRESAPEELSLENRTILNSIQKENIAYEASGMIARGSCIYLDAGTTCQALAAMLCSRDDLTVVTCDLNIAHILASGSSNTVIIAGGKVSHSDLSTSGHLAVNALEGMSLDMAFLSASSFDSRGITTPDPDKVPVKQHVARMARQRYLICDSSKYGQVATYIAVPAGLINMIITDAALSDSGRNALLKAGCDLIMVPFN